jgi:hypothetical protein
VENQVTNTTGAEMLSGIFFPLLCAVNDGDYGRTIALILEMRDGTPAHLPGRTCGKSVPGGFDICWNCGAERMDLSEVS